MTLKIDDADLKIIDILKKDSKRSNREIAKEINLHVTTVYNRIQRLEREGIIEKYTVSLNHKKLGLKLIAYVFLHYDISIWGKKSNREDLKRRLKALPNIEEIKYIIGRHDILLKFYLRDMDDLNVVLLDHLRKVPGIGQTETFLVLEDVL